MKQTITYITLFFFLVSCKGQNTKLEKIDASKVKEITLVNKVDYATHKLKANNIVVKDKQQIEKIVSAFSYSENYKPRISSGANYGFFEVKFFEGEKEFYYTINYTVYDGVIVRNDLNGDIYKNERLEGVVYPLFVE